MHPLILFDSDIIILPDKITLSSDKEIEFSNLPVIGSYTTLTACNQLKDKIVFQSGKEPRSVTRECKTVNGINSVYLSTSNNSNNKDDDKKLSSGAIAGIVVACLAVLFVIIAVIVVVVYRKKHDVHSKGLVDMDDLS